MTKYQHTKGIITDNAIQALLHDPLFSKGKGSYTRKAKHGKKGSWEAVGKIH